MELLERKICILEKSREDNSLPSQVELLKAWYKENHEALDAAIYSLETFETPFEYLVGYGIFLGRIFRVDRRVYISNPETENLTKKVLENIKDFETVIDIGTGSGTIAISIKKEKPNTRVIATDIDSIALDVARKNAKMNGADIHFYQSVYTDQLPGDLNPDILVSDMPYGDERYVLPSIPRSRLNQLPPNSLWHPKGPLEAYKELILSIQRKGWHPRLFIETGSVEREEVSAIIPVGLCHKYMNFGDSYSVTEVQL